MFILTLNIISADKASPSHKRAQADTFNDPTINTNFEC